MSDARDDKAALDLLSEFLGDLAQLPKTIVEGMLNQAETQDEREVIRALGGTLTSQFSELTGYIRDRSGRLSAQQRQESEQVLRLSSAGSMIASGSSLAGNLTSQVAKIGLAGIVIEIKKIIRLLLGAFGIKIPKWLDLLFLLIDQLMHLLLSTGSPGLANTLSRGERNQLAEFAHHYRLQRENDLRSELDNDENS